MATEIIREIVSELRDRRLRDASAAELAHYLQTLGVDESGLGPYMKEAFCLSRTPRLSMLQRDRSGAFLDSALDAALGQPIDAARDLWTAAGPYPDLIRRRDRRAFHAVAQNMELIIFVSAAPASSERYVGRSGYRPAPPWLEGATRATQPNAGLVAADPGDSNLMRRLQSAGSTFAEYQRRLESNGFVIGSSADGYIIRDHADAAFYPGYRLHGVYSAITGRNAWTPEQGERIRAALNLRLGEELVQCGPYAVRDRRLSSLDDALSGHFPLLIFAPDSAAYVVHDAAGLAAEYGFRKILGEPLTPIDSPPTAEGE